MGDHRDLGLGRLLRKTFWMAFGGNSCEVRRGEERVYNVVMYGRYMGVVIVSKTRFRRNCLGCLGLLLSVGVNGRAKRAVSCFVGQVDRSMSQRQFLRNSWSVSHSRIEGPRQQIKAGRGAERCEVARRI